MEAHESGEAIGSAAAQNENLAAFGINEGTATTYAATARAAAVWQCANPVGRATAAGATTAGATACGARTSTTGYNR